MSFEPFALANIQKRHPAVQKQGFRHLLDELDVTSMSGVDCRPGFFPDGFDYDKQKQTLTLYEIEDTWPLTEEKLHKIQIFAHDLYDVLEIETTIISTDRYGVNETRVWGIEDDLLETKRKKLEPFLHRREMRRSRKAVRDLDIEPHENNHRAAYSPAEFAASCGKHPTWAYRLLYAGKINAVTSLGRILIPATELTRVLSEAKPYDPQPKS